MDPTLNIHDLFKHHKLTSPLSIRVNLGSDSLEGELSNNGEVRVNDQVYANIDQAMKSLLNRSDSTSNAWQFWSFYSAERAAWTPLEHLRAQLETQQKPNEIKTSLTHPLLINEVTTPNMLGRIGLTFCPGKVCKGLYGGTWERDLLTDIDTIISWGSTTLITLMEEHEFTTLGVPNFPEVLTNSKLEWLHLPIRDMQTPDTKFEDTWSEVGPKIHRQLIEGDSVVIHCRGGLGRTGLLAARILCEAGIEPVEAIRKVRTARENAIETYAQEEYVLSQAWKAP